MRLKVGIPSPSHCCAFWSRDQIYCCMQRLTLDTLLHPGLQGHCTVACTHASLGSFASHSLLRCFLARFQTETLGMGGGAEEMKLQISRVICLLHIWYLGLMCEQFVRNSQYSQNCLWCFPAVSFPHHRKSLKRPGDWLACLCTLRIFFKCEEHFPWDTLNPQI